MLVECRMDKWTQRGVLTFLHCSHTGAAVSADFRPISLFFQLDLWMLSLHMPIVWKYQKLAQIIRWTNQSTSTQNENQNCWPKEHSKCQEWLRSKISRSCGGDLSNLEIWFGLVETKSEDQDQTERCWKHISLSDVRYVWPVHYRQFKFRFKLKAQKFNNDRRKAQNLSPLPSNR